MEICDWSRGLQLDGLMSIEVIKLKTLVYLYFASFIYKVIIEIYWHSQVARQMLGKMPISGEHIGHPKNIQTFWIYFSQTQKSVITHTSGIEVSFHLVSGVPAADRSKWDDGGFRSDTHYPLNVPVSAEANSSEQRTLSPSASCDNTAITGNNHRVTARSRQRTHSFTMGIKMPNRWKTFC